MNKEFLGLYNKVWLKMKTLKFKMTYYKIPALISQDFGKHTIYSVS